MTDANHMTSAEESRALREVGHHSAIVAGPGAYRVGLSSVIHMRGKPGGRRMWILDWLARQSEQGEVECRNVELSLLEQDPAARLLDLGCGDGDFTLRAAAKTGTRSICGVEIAQESLDKAKAKGIEVHQLDLNERLPLDDESFDVIIASHVIEHLADTDILLSEIHRLLRGGGYLVIATPNLAALPHIVLLLFGKQPAICEVSDEFLVGTWSSRGNRVNRVGPAHRRIFTLGALTQLLECHGLQVEKATGTGYLPLPIRLARIMCRMDRRHAFNMVVKARRSSADHS